MKNQKLLKLLATVTTTLVISNMNLTVVNANEIDLNTFSLTQNSNDDTIDIDEQVYLTLFANSDPSKTNEEQVNDNSKYLEQGFYHSHMLKVNKLILSRLLQNVEKSPFVKGVKANQVTNELSYQSEPNLSFITRIDLDGQGSTLTYASENYQNLWLMRYSANENHSTSNGTYQFVISEINNRHLNLSYTKGSKMLTIFYHAFPTENQYICFFLKSEEEVIKVLMTMTEAMNKKESIDEFLTSEIILEIDTTKQLSKIYRKSENNKILKKQSTIK